MSRTSGCSGCRTIFGLPVDVLAACSGSWVEMGFNPNDYMLKAGDNMTGTLDMENKANITIATGGSLTTPSALIGSLGLVSQGAIDSALNPVRCGNITCRDTAEPEFAAIISNMPNAVDWATCTSG